MYLLYLGSSGGAGARHSILAGISVFERQSYWIAQELDRIAGRFAPGSPQDVVLSGQAMATGAGMWAAHPLELRRAALEDTLRAFANSHISNRLFASIIRTASEGASELFAVAHEQIVGRFDYYLQRMHRSGDTQRGVIIFSQPELIELAVPGGRHALASGAHRAIIRNLAEAPLLIDPRSSRLAQLSDVVTFALTSAYEDGDQSLAALIANRFDMEAGVVQSLYTRL